MNAKLSLYKAPPRQRKTALVYVMRPTSTREAPVWDLLRSIHYYSGQHFDLSKDNGLYYLVMSPTGEILADTTRPVISEN